MSRANEVFAALLREYAELIQMTGGDVFRARIYEKTARSIAGHPGDILQMDAAELRQIPGIGKSIAEKIGEFAATGSIRALEELRADIPDGVLQMTRIRHSGRNGPSSSTESFRSARSASSPTRSSRASSQG